MRESYGFVVADTKAQALATVPAAVDAVCVKEWRDPLLKRIVRVWRLKMVSP